MRKPALAGACCNVFLVLALFACRQERPLTPEEVVRQWQRHIDRNEFDDARALSTSQARIFVDEVDSYTPADTLGVVETQLLNLQCETIGDSAVCRYEFDFEGSREKGLVTLRRVKKQWLVAAVDYVQPPPPDSLQKGEENLIFPEDSVDEELE